MNIQELSQSFSISEDTFHAVKKVEEVSGKPIRFQLVDKLLSHAVLKVARNSMITHLVLLRNKDIENINHLIIHECHHVFRFWSVADEERKILSSSNEGLDRVQKIWKKELGKKAEKIPPSLFQMWEKGLFTLLYNAFTDTRIEEDIYMNYPNTREEQLRSLKKMEKEIRLGTGSDVEKMLPSSLYLLANAMNYAFLSRLTPIVGKSWKKDFKGRSDILTLGQRLLKAIPDKDDGLLQDIEVINRWTKIINVEDCVNWSNFEDVPLGYEYMY